MNALRSLPKVDRLAEAPELAAWPRAVRIGAARQVVQEARERMLRGAPVAVDGLVALAAERARWLADGRLVPVINATGVVVHTNLGRAPWSPSAVAAAQRVARYCDLELDREAGVRGGRQRGVRAQILHLTGAESALVVNNNAAAVLLALTALAAGREVVVSRGELVEIGGSFRVPDVISSGGARLREVGTTNRTRIGDYAGAIGPDTAMLLKVHPSNFRVAGFTEAPTREELAALGRERGVPVMEDLGSGAVSVVGDEPPVRDVVASGIDLVCFSGDKLLGGPQAGVLVGRADLVERARQHPMYRAMRVDKVILAALEATLGDHIAGRPVPVTAALGEAVEDVRARAAALRDLLARSGVSAEIVELPSVVGGGALPGAEVPSAGVHVRCADAEGVSRRLRTGSPAVLGRIHDGALLLDARTVADAEVEPLAAAVRAATA